MFAIKNCSRLCLNYRALTIPKSRIHQNPKLCSGHSHWQNIQSSKNAKDREKSRIMLRHSKNIKSIINATKSTDVKSNTMLAKAIEEARKDNMPTSSINRILDKGKAGSVSTVAIRANGGGGIKICISAETSARKALEDSLRTCFKKNGFVYCDDKGLDFESKGVIHVESDQTLDEMTDLGIELGADEVMEESGRKCFVFITDADSFLPIEQSLTKRGYSCCYSAIEYSAYELVDVEDGPFRKAYDKLLSSLQGFEDINRVYDNLKCD